MNRPVDRASTRPSVSRLVGSGIVMGAWLLAGTLRADEPPKPAGGPILNLTDGGFVNGSLEDSSQQGVVRWKSPAFTTPLEFPVKLVQSIRFPTVEKLPRPTGSYGFELTGGDLLFGSIVSLDDKQAELDVARLGRIKVERSRLRRIFRWRDGGDLVFNGPNGLAGWKEVIPPKKPQAQNGQQVGIAFAVNGMAQPPPPPVKPVAPAGPAWIEEGGQLQTSKVGATIQANIGLPSKASLEIELSWKKTPDFLLAIGVNDDESSVNRAFRFEVWDNQVVAVRVLNKAANLTPIQTIGAGPGRLQLQLYLDQEAGKLLVFSTGGTLLADLKAPGSTGPALPGIRLSNLRGDLCLERLRVARWDGETPRPVDPNLSRVQLTDLSNVRGQVERLDPATHEFIVKEESGETRILEDKVSTIFLAQPDDNAPRTIRAVYQDGTRLGGEWSKVEGGSLVMESPGITGPLRLTTDGLRSVEVLHPDKPAFAFNPDLKALAFNEKPPTKPPGTGTLEMDGVKMLGRLADSGDGPGQAALAWQPLASQSSSPIAPGASGRILYKTITPPTELTPAQRAQAQRAAQIAAAQRAAQQRNPVNMLMDAFGSPSSGPAKGATRRTIYLRTGDIIPGEVLKIDEKGVTFRTDLSPSSFVPHNRIKAVEMTPDLPNAMKLTKAKLERLLTLPRMQRDSPPTQLIRSKNGDILRGRIIAMDDKTIRVEIRLEEKEIPRDRISRIIWLHADEVDPSKKQADPPETAGKTRVQAVKSDGIRLTFNAERYNEGALLGKSDVLGDCRVKLDDVDQLLLGGSVEKEATQLAYQNLKLQNAPDPKSALVDEDGSPSGGSEGTESALVGKPAPDFELSLLDGTKFHLADHKGEVIVLDFWATWCGPCLQAMPQVEKATHEFADKGVKLIAVNLQETPEKIKALLERQKLSPTVALDRDGVVAQRYAANAIPQTVVIDREGKVSRLFIGSSPKLGDNLRDAIQALMPEAKP